MNKLIVDFLLTYGIPDTPDISEEKRERLTNDDRYYYRIDDNLQGWWIKEITPSNPTEDLIVDTLKTRFPSY